MRRHSTSWFQGWKILLKCAEFRCDDGSLKFTSTAILKHMPPTADCMSLQWPDKMKRSIVFPEDAFGSCEDANTDAMSRARRQILAMNGSTDISGRKIVDCAGNKGARQESDESLAAQYEISFGDDASDDRRSDRLSAPVPDASIPDIAPGRSPLLPLLAMADDGNGDARMGGGASLPSRPL